MNQNHITLPPEIVFNYWRPNVAGGELDFEKIIEIDCTNLCFDGVLGMIIQSARLFGARRDHRVIADYIFELDDLNEYTFCFYNASTVQQDSQEDFWRFIQDLVNRSSFADNKIDFKVSLS
jgi:hypothetical protein